MKACQLKNEIYEPKKLEAVYQNIVARSKTDKPQFYEIRVDDFVVVEKTNDPERFMNYAEFVDGSTKYISVFLYHTNSNASDKLFFHLQANQFSQPVGLNGVTTNESPLEQEKNQKEKWRKDLHYEQLLEENADLKKEIEELEQTIEIIEEEKNTFKANRDLGFVNIAGYFFEGAMNSKFVKDNVPFMNDLSGIKKEPAETENTFKRKYTSTKEPEDVESEVIPPVEISEEDKHHIGIMRIIKSRVGEIELANVIHLLELVTTNPQSIHFAIKQVSNYIKQKPTTPNTTPLENLTESE